MMFRSILNRSLECTLALLGLHRTSEHQTSNSFRSASKLAFYNWRKSISIKGTWGELGLELRQKHTKSIVKLSEHLNENWVKAYAEFMPSWEELGQGLSGLGLSHAELFPFLLKLAWLCWIHSFLISFFLFFFFFFTPFYLIFTYFLQIIYIKYPKQ